MPYGNIINRTTALSTSLLCVALTGCGDDVTSQSASSTSGDASTDDAADASTTGSSASNGSMAASDVSSDGDGEVGSSETGSSPTGPRVVPLPGEALFPEGITATMDGTLFVGSVGEASVLRIEPPYGEDNVSVFSAGQLSRAAIGVFVDEVRGVLLVCDSNPGAPSSSGLSVLDLTDGTRIVEHVIAPADAEGPVFCNDGFIGEDGAAYVTDSFGGRILRIADVGVEDAAVEVFVADPLLAAPPEAFGANGLTIVDGEMYAVNFAAGSLLHVERTDGDDAVAVVDVPLIDEGGRAVTLVGPDGIEPADDGGLLIVENGIFGDGKGNRVVEVTLAGGQGTVRELAGPFDVPTTVALTDTDLWVVQSQFDHLFGLDESPPEPFTLVGLLR
ncbi:MAG: hypothetical protein AAGA54_17550 [Myxococcota bacterium]